MYEQRQAGFAMRVTAVAGLSVLALAGGPVMPVAAAATSATWTTLSSSANPALVGQAVTFTAVVKVVGGGGPLTGTVAFKDGATPLATVALDVSGIATLSTSSLTLGTHAVTATYSGDGNFAASTSEPLSQAVPTSTGCPSPSFFPSTVPTGFYVFKFVTADFNLDGKLDVAGVGGDKAPVLLGDGHGGFSPAPGSPLVLAASTSMASVGDINVDGKPDLVMTICQSSNNCAVSVWLGDGTGAFTPVASPATIGSAGDPVVSDFNVDGKPDLAIANRFGNAISILLGDGAGSFTNAPDSPISISTPWSPAVSDFNRDGRPDLVVVSPSSAVTLLQGDGAGRFTAGAISSASVGANPQLVMVGDFNLDGKQDLAVHNGLSTLTVTIALGDGSGAFAPGSVWSAGNASTTLSGWVVGDFDSDGKPDLATGDSLHQSTGASGTRIKLLLGDGTGAFQVATVDNPAPTYGDALLSGDFDGDGRADLISWGINPTLTSMSNNCAAPAPTVDVSSSPNPSLPGQTVTLSATVSSLSGPGAPTGQVQFFDTKAGSSSASALGLPTPLSAGTTTQATSTLSDGIHSITAVYFGDANFRGGSSAPFTHTVHPRVTINDGTANSASATTLSFTVVLSAASALPVTMSYAMSDHTAKAGIDYTATSGTLTFDPAQTSKTITVAIPQGAPGPSKDFFITLSGLSGATFSKATGIGTIQYSAPGSLMLYIDDPSLQEGNTGSTLLAFTLSLSRASNTAVSVDFATANGTATAGSDYTTRTGTVSFFPGQTTRIVLVPVLGNTTLDSNRTLFVNLTNLNGGAQAGKSQGTGTILDDDPSTATTGATQLRLYSTSTFEHLYTTDTNEYAVLATRGWLQEGSAYTIFGNAGPYGGVFTGPIYRLYHAGILQHHWTTDANEVLALAAGAWNYEGISGYILPAPMAGAVPLYRMAYRSPALHLWTIDQNEYDTLATRSWVKEGIVGYVIP